MDAVERGETLIITRNGTPIAELRPIRRRTFVPSSEIKRLFSGLTGDSYAVMRDETDALLGDDRL